MNDLLERDKANMPTYNNLGQDCGIRRYNKCVLKGVPNETNEAELIEFLSRLVPDLSNVPRIHFNYPNQPKIVSRQVSNGVKESCELYCLQAFVYFNDDIDCKKVVNYFQPFNEANIGVKLTNTCSISGNVFAHFLYTPDDDNFYVSRRVGCDVNRLQKQPHAIIIYRVPLGTHEDELKIFLTKLTKVNIKTISFRVRFENKLAFVVLSSNEECDTLIHYFKKYNHSGAGLLFENSCGNSLGLFASFVYIKENKINNEFVIKNVPVDTQIKEIVEMIRTKCSENITFLHKLQSGTIWFFRAENTNAVINIINSSISNALFTNQNGSCGYLSIHYRHQEKIDYDLRFQRSRVHLKNIVNSNMTREPNALCILNIPLGTDEDEILLMFAMLDPDWLIENIMMKEEIFNNKAMSLSAKLVFSNDTNCMQAYEYFQSSSQQDGYVFVNAEGVKSRLLIDFYFSKFKNYTGLKDNQMTWYGDTKIDKTIIAWNIDVAKTEQDIESMVLVCSSVRVNKVILKKKVDSTKQYAFIWLHSNEDCDTVVKLFQQPDILFNNGNIFVYYAFKDSLALGYNSKKSTNGLLNKAVTDRLADLSLKELSYIKADNSSCNQTIHTDSGLYFKGIPLNTTVNELKEFIYQITKVKFVKLIFDKRNMKRASIYFLNDIDCEVVMQHLGDRIQFTNQSNMLGFLEPEYLYGETFRVNTKLLLQNIPSETSCSEIETMIGEILKGNSQKFSLILTKSKENEESYFDSSLISMSCSSDCEEVLKFFLKFDDGYCFTNHHGNISHITAIPYFTSMWGKRYYDNKFMDSQLTFFNLPHETSIQDLCHYVCDVLTHLTSISNIVLKESSKNMMTGFVYMQQKYCTKFMSYLTSHNMLDGFTFINSRGGKSTSAVVKYFPTSHASEYKEREAILDYQMGSEDTKRYGLVYSNIPDATTPDDFVLFLNRVVPAGRRIAEVRVYKPQHAHTIFLNNTPMQRVRYKFFVIFYSCNDRDAVLQYFLNVPNSLWFVGKNTDIALLQMEVMYDDNKTENNNIDICNIGSSNIGSNNIDNSNIECHNSDYMKNSLTPEKSLEDIITRIKGTLIH